MYRFYQLLFFNTSQTTENRFIRIRELENQICDDLGKLKKIDFDRKSEKEQKEYFEICQKFENLSKMSLKEMTDICDEFGNLVSKLKVLIIPDEKNWKQWTGKDLKRLVQNLNVVCSGIHELEVLQNYLNKTVSMIIYF